MPTVSHPAPALLLGLALVAVLPASMARKKEVELYEAVMTHFMGHYYANEKDKERKAVMEREASMKGPAMAPEAGGMPGENGKQSPKAGGMSDAMQTPQGQNPGPRDGEAPPKPGPRDGEGPPRVGPRDGEGPPKPGPREG